jgi:hypothetical protein
VAGWREDMRRKPQRGLEIAWRFARSTGDSSADERDWNAAVASVISLFVDLTLTALTRNLSRLPRSAFSSVRFYLSRTDTCEPSGREPESPKTINETLRQFLSFRFGIETYVRIVTEHLFSTAIQATYHTLDGSGKAAAAPPPANGLEGLPKIRLMRFEAAV